MAEPFLSPIIMSAGGPYRNTHHLSGFCKAEVVVEYKLQNFLLPFRQPGQRLPEQRLNLRPVDYFIRSVGRSVLSRAPLVLRQPEPR